MHYNDPFNYFEFFYTINNAVLLKRENFVLQTSKEVLFWENF
jgi:hypothetical protein